MSERLAVAPTPRGRLPGMRQPPPALSWRRAARPSGTSATTVDPPRRAASCVGAHLVGAHLRARRPRSRVRLCSGVDVDNRGGTHGDRSSNRRTARRARGGSRAVRRARRVLGADRRRRDRVPGRTRPDGRRSLRSGHHGDALPGLLDQQARRCPRDAPACRSRLPRSRRGRQRPAHVVARAAYRATGSRSSRCGSSSATAPASPPPASLAIARVTRFRQRSRCSTAPGRRTRSGCGSIPCPGLQFRYSGGGTLVMQQLLEDVTGHAVPRARARAGAGSARDDPTATTRSRCPRSSDGVPRRRTTRSAARSRAAGTATRSSRPPASGRRPATSRRSRSGSSTPTPAQRVRCSLRRSARELLTPQVDGRRVSISSGSGRFSAARADEQVRSPGRQRRASAATCSPTAIPARVQS